MSATEDRKEKGLAYELCYLVLPSIPEENLSQSVDKLKSIIKKEGGVEIVSEEPFRYPLAYSMSKMVGSSKYVVNEAYIGWIKFDTSPEEDEDTHPVERIKSEVDKLDEILRFLLVKVPRETTFTFAEAREAAKLRELPQVESSEEAIEEAVETPLPVVEGEEESPKEDVVE